MRMTRGRIPGPPLWRQQFRLSFPGESGSPVGQTFLSRWKYGRASRYLAVSEHVKRKLVEAEIPADKISVVYDGVDVPSKRFQRGSGSSLRRHSTR